MEEYKEVDREQEDIRVFGRAIEEVDKWGEVEDKDMDKEQVQEEARYNIFLNRVEVEDMEEGEWDSTQVGRQVDKEGGV